MTRIIWGDTGNKLYEAGVDRGVLFVGTNAGVPWDGLVGVDEKPSGGTVTPYYLDGVRYLTSISREEYAATLEAFYSPPEFDLCDGTWPLLYNVVAMHMARSPFNLTYRTRIGNDVEALNYGYKIHLIYNAYATPAEHAYKTTDASADIDTLSWDIQANPTTYSGYPVSAHFVLDSTTVHSSALAAVEEALYGTPDAAPYFPTLDQLLALMAANFNLDINDNGDGTYVAAGDAVIDNEDGSFGISNADLVDNGDGTFTVASA